MGKNDHQPVPDPVQKPDFAMTQKEPVQDTDELQQKAAMAGTRGPVPVNVEKSNPDLICLTSYVSQLQGGLNAVLDKLKTMTIRRETDYQDVIQLRVNLKLTIRAVERLAKGKSLGALGLPGEEEWKETL
ncbi:hypothetical protein LCGC14_1797260 [marine sediment metagenome]|uniref:Uncharacterized protein n=1 Tax=marine sediment metagenome TaxID=412755 RepID=A0A0F9JQ79_9ZZZZ